MDVLSVESCVQAVIGAYRDASKLVQRLKDKQKNSEEFILPENLTGEFEDSLSLGCIAVQSQYDHDVRRFGETYARGDAIAREQMKDILIALQQAVISHLREVFMDEATLDLHRLRETSDDSRVNATVCLGQLYQRMSSASAAMKQISRPHLEEPDKVQLPVSLAYSSSRSTHSSFGGQPFDSQSATSSYTTYSSRTAVGHDRNSSGAPVPQRRISMTSAFSYTSDQPKSITPGEDSVPALPFPMQRQSSQGAVDTISSRPEALQQPEDRETPPNAAPPPYKPNMVLPTPIGDEKGQNFPRESSFYDPPSAQAQGYQPQVSPPQRSPRMASEVNFSRPSPSAPIHELDNSPPSDKTLGDRISDAQSPQRTPPADGSASRQRAVPLNPDYSTLEYVATLDSRSRPPVSSMGEAQSHRFLQELQLQREFQPGFQDQGRTFGYSHPVSPVSRPHTSSAEMGSVPAPLDPLLQQRVPTIPTISRPLSIRSTASTGSRISTYVVRRGLPPGIADAVNKPATSTLEAQLNTQPRYIRPKPLDLNNNLRAYSGQGPTSPIAQHVDNTNGDDGTATTSTSESVSLESIMRVPGAPASPALQVPKSELNLPSEANLAGFCKGAVRQQLGARKKGFSLENRKGPVGLEYFWRCSKCNFEGPASVSRALPSGGRGAVKSEKAFDTRVRRSNEGGIKYRWNFLAKCHVAKKLTIGDSLNSGDVFACYFCCAEGAANGWTDDTVSAQLATLGTFGDKKMPAANTTPTFNGLQAFLSHLETHRLPNRMPGLIVANEMNCIVGRVAHDQEDFDLNLPPLAK